MGGTRSTTLTPSIALPVRFFRKILIFSSLLCYSPESLSAIVSFTAMIGLRRRK